MRSVLTGASDFCDYYREGDPGRLFTLWLAVFRGFLKMNELYIGSRVPPALSTVVVKKVKLQGCKSFDVWYTVFETLIMGTF